MMTTADLPVEPTSWAPEVFVEGKWSRNGLRFATEAEAYSRAEYLYVRWTLAKDYRATPAAEPVNYRLSWSNGELEPVS